MSTKPIDVTGGESDQHVHVLGLIVPVEDIDLDPVSESQHVDIVLPLDHAPKSSPQTR